MNWKQIHGKTCVELNSQNHQPGEADAFFTTSLGMPLRSSTADCVPILFATRDGSAIAAVHAGWRGTAQKITRSLWQKISILAPAADWVAVLGPSIRPCCYEVSSDLVEEFAATFPEYNRSDITPQTRMLDLARINLLELKALGIKDVEVMPHCTYCSTNPEFFSYRRRTKLGLNEGKLCQWSTIMRAEFN